MEVQRNLDVLFSALSFYVFLNVLILGLRVLVSPLVSLQWPKKLGGVKHLFGVALLPPLHSSSGLSPQVHLS